MGKISNRFADRRNLMLQQQQKDAGSVTLYQTRDILKAGGMTLVTPEGMQAFRTGICNIAFTPRGKNEATFAAMTGYGASYMAKVRTGTNRAPERIIEVTSGGDQGDLLQISVTLWNALTDSPADSDSVDVHQLVRCALNSLPDQYRRRFAGRCEIGMGKLANGNKIGYVSCNNQMDFA